MVLMGLTRPHATPCIHFARRNPPLRQSLLRDMRFLAAALMVVTLEANAQAPYRQTSDIPFVPTSQAVAEAMLKLANVQSGDLLVDLGSGDGRIPILAAKQTGCRAIGVELDHALILESRAAAEREGVAGQVQFIEGDLFRQDLRKATVVTMFLLPSVNLRLKPKLLQELAPGSRIVAHRFDLGNWKPDRTLNVEGEPVYLWIVPSTKH